MLSGLSFSLMQRVIFKGCIIICPIAIACNSAIPFTKLRQQSGRIAGWSEYVQPLRQKSLFWHHLWVQNGRPRSGAVADCMRRSRAAYHYAVRSIKKDEYNIRCERIMNSAAMNDDRSFGLKLKKIGMLSLLNVKRWMVLVMIVVLHNCLR